MTETTHPRHSARGIRALQATTVVQTGYRQGLSSDVYSSRIRAGAIETTDNAKNIILPKPAIISSDCQPYRVTGM